MNNDATVPALGEMLNGAIDLPSRYQHQRILGVGGMGIVIEAIDLELDQRVAIKIMHEDISVEQHQRFLKEARTLAQLTSPNIVKIKSFGITDSGKPFQVMELLKGEPLSARIKNQSLKAQEFREIFSQVTLGLEYAAAKGIVHRDIKPSNIFLHKVDGHEIVKVVDFGIARIENPDQSLTTGLTATNMAVGSPLYMSPEQCKGFKVDYLSDIYSLACVMYECLAGVPPFQGETPLDTMYQHATTPATPLETKCESSQVLADLIMKCLAKTPADRVQSYAQIREVLAAALPSEAISIGIRKEPEPQSKKEKSVVLLACVTSLSIALVGAGCFAYIQGKREVTDYSEKSVAKKVDPAAKPKAELARHLDQLKRVHDPEDRKVIYTAIFCDCQNIGSAYAKGGDIENAVKYAKMSLDYSPQSEWPMKHKLLARKQVAMYYRDNDFPVEAEKWFKSAMEVFKESPNPSILRESAKVAAELAIMYAREGQMKKARENIVTYLPLLKNVMCDPAAEARASGITKDYRTELAMTIYGQMVGTAKLLTTEDRIEAVEIYLTLADYLLHFHDQTGEAGRVLNEAQLTLAKLPADAANVPGQRVRLITLRLVEAKLHKRSSVKLLEEALQREKGRK